MKEYYKFLVVFSFFDIRTGKTINKNLIRYTTNKIPTEFDLEDWKKYYRRMLREEDTSNITIL
jgi:hypothetical protein